MAARLVFRDRRGRTRVIAEAFFHQGGAIALSIRVMDREGASRLVGDAFVRRDGTGELAVAVLDRHGTARAASAFFLREDGSFVVFVGFDRAGVRRLIAITVGRSTAFPALPSADMREVFGSGDQERPRHHHLLRAAPLALARPDPNPNPNRGGGGLLPGADGWLLRLLHHAVPGVHGPRRILEVIAALVGLDAPPRFPIIDAAVLRLDAPPQLHLDAPPRFWMTDAVVLRLHDLPRFPHVGAAFAADVELLLLRLLHAAVPAVDGPQRIPVLNAAVVRLDAPLQFPQTAAASVGQYEFLRFLFLAAAAVGTGGLRLLPLQAAALGVDALLLVLSAFAVDGLIGAISVHQNGMGELVVVALDRRGTRAALARFLREDGALLVFVASNRAGTRRLFVLTAGTPSALPSADMHAVFGHDGRRRLLPAPAEVDLEHDGIQAFLAAGEFRHDGELVPRFPGAPLGIDRLQHPPAARGTPRIPHLTAAPGNGVFPANPNPLDDQGFNQLEAGTLPSDPSALLQMVQDLLPRMDNIPYDINDSAISEATVELITQLLSHMSETVRQQIISALLPPPEQNPPQQQQQNNPRRMWRSFVYTVGLSVASNVALYLLSLGLRVLDNNAEEQKDCCRVLDNNAEKQKDCCRVLDNNAEKQKDCSRVLDHNAEDAWSQWVMRFIGWLVERILAPVVLTSLVIWVRENIIGREMHLMHYDNNGTTNVLVNGLSRAFFLAIRGFPSIGQPQLWARLAATLVDLLGAAFLYWMGGFWDPDIADGT